MAATTARTPVRPAQRRKASRVQHGRLEAPSPNSRRRKRRTAEPASRCFEALARTSARSRSCPPALEQLQFLANDLQETLRKRMPLVNFSAGVPHKRAGNVPDSLLPARREPPCRLASHVGVSPAILFEFRQGMEIRFLVPTTAAIVIILACAPAFCIVWFGEYAESQQIESAQRRIEVRCPFQHVRSDRSLHPGGFD